METTANAAREMTPLERVGSRLSIWLAHLLRKLPHLVWYGQEVDVCVTFSTDKLDPDDPMRSFFAGSLREAQEALGAAGISFDTGQGCEGRDWEWDFSLRGPISVVFRRRAEHPERRRERPRPTLRVDNTRQVS